MGCASYRASIFRNKLQTSYCSLGACTCWRDTWLSIDRPPVDLGPLDYVEFRRAKIDDLEKSTGNSESSGIWC